MSKFDTSLVTTATRAKSSEIPPAQKIAMGIMNKGLRNRTARLLTDHKPIIDAANALPESKRDLAVSVILSCLVESLVEAKLEKKKWAVQVVSPESEGGKAVLGIMAKALPTPSTK